jgi:hypothetical protein
MHERRITVAAPEGAPHRGRAQARATTRAVIDAADPDSITARQGQPFQGRFAGRRRIADGARRRRDGPKCASVDHLEAEREPLVDEALLRRDQAAAGCHRTTSISGGCQVPSRIASLPQ